FYTQVLGLRLVKLTVNFADTSGYHLYYGDRKGTPGTLLTFFSWPSAPQGRRGTGQATSFSYSIGKDSMGFWEDHLKSNNVKTETSKRFGEEVLSFHDPNGLLIELVNNGKGGGLKDGPVPAKHAISDFHGISLTEEGEQLTSGVLTKTMGLEKL